MQNGGDHRATALLETVRDLRICGAQSSAKFVEQFREPRHKSNYNEDRPIPWHGGLHRENNINGGDHRATDDRPHTEVTS